MQQHKLNLNHRYSKLQYLVMPTYVRWPYEDKHKRPPRTPRPNSNKIDTKCQEHPSKRRAVEGRWLVQRRERKTEKKYGSRSMKTGFGSLEKWFESAKKRESGSLKLVFDEVEMMNFLKEKNWIFFIKVDKGYMKMKREEDDNRSYHMLWVHDMPCVLFKSNRWSPILNDTWKRVNGFCKILTERTKIVNDIRFMRPNWDTL